MLLSISACLTMPDVQWESLHLERLMETRLPREHPMYGHVSRAVQMLQNNPGWSWPHKEHYLVTLIERSKRLTA